MGRINCNCYSFERRVIKDHHLQNITTDDGTLYAGYHRTKILPQDLPAWYVYGRYYKCFGYMNTKGITDLLYEPYHSSNHFLKDDALYIAYGGKIAENPEPIRNRVYREKYVGYDEVIFGNAMLDILRGARIFSHYDISDIIEQSRSKHIFCAGFPSCPSKTVCPFPHRLTFFLVFSIDGAKHLQETGNATTIVNNIQTIRNNTARLFINIYGGHFAG